MTLLPVVLAALLAQAPPSGEMAVAPGGSLEGRPPVANASPLQARIDATPPGGRLVVDGGVHRGDLYIDRPLRLIGRNGARILGSGTGSVVRIRAADVTIEEMEIDGRAGGDLALDPSGIHVAAPRATVRRCRIVNSLFGVYLREADGSRVEETTILGVPDKSAGEKGSGIHVFNTQGFTLLGNRIEAVRDGLYIQSSGHGVIRGNVARDLRYGLHYMFSDDNLFEDNLFERGAAGTALMYSKRIVFRRNRFVRNRGFASVGLLFKACDDVLAEENLVADNARGIFLEGSYRTLFRRNVVAQSDTAVVLYDSDGGHRFEGNAFVANLSPLLLVGRRTDTRFTGNYWSEHRQPDLDGDGHADVPYRLVSAFDHLRGNLTAADIMAQGFAASAIALAETAFPVIEPASVLDERPLARPPDLSGVPSMDAAGPMIGSGGLVASATVLLFGAGLLACGRSPSAPAAAGSHAGRHP